MELVRKAERSSPGSLATCRKPIHTRKHSASTMVRRTQFRTWLESLRWPQLQSLYHVDLSGVKISVQYIGHAHVPSDNATWHPTTRKPPYLNNIHPESLPLNHVHDRMLRSTVFHETYRLTLVSGKLTYARSCSHTKQSPRPFVHIPHCRKSASFDYIIAAIQSSLTPTGGLLVINGRRSYLDNIHPAPLPQPMRNRDASLPLPIRDFRGLHYNPCECAGSAALGEGAGVDDDDGLDDL